MKGWIQDILAALIMGLVIPGMVLNGAVALWHREDSAPVSVVTMGVRVRTGETVQEGQMDDYLPGVVLAEMPASFEEEALKAQAVVARTYARKAYLTGGKHGDGSVCTQPSCCQGYLSEADYLAGGGTAEAVDRVKAAVAATAGQVLTYEGELIEATYFSCSGGRTEDAVAVWGQDFPYLRSVESPGEEEAAAYRQELTFTRQELEAKLDQPLEGKWLGEISYTNGGSVDTAVLGGKTFTGIELRSLLGLRSTAFTLETAGDSVIIVTKGYGHRVGMSQYGADAMASEGSTYDQILAYYYQGTVLE